MLTSFHFWLYVYVAAAIFLVIANALCTKQRRGSRDGDMTSSDIKRAVYDAQLQYDQNWRADNSKNTKG